MLRESVESSCVVAIGYDADLEIMEVELINGKVYAYFGVPKWRVVDFLTAESKGKFYNDWVKGWYDSQKMPNDAA